MSKYYVYAISLTAGYKVRHVCGSLAEAGLWLAANRRPDMCMAVREGATGKRFACIEAWAAAFAAHFGRAWNAAEAYVYGWEPQRLLKMEYTYAGVAA